MTSLNQWRTWLKSNADALQSEGFIIQMTCGPDGSPKPGIAFEIAGRTLYSAVDKLFIAVLAMMHLKRVRQHSGT
jgi:hypothetical protein